MINAPRGWSPGVVRRSSKARNVAAESQARSRHRVDPRLIRHLGGRPLSIILVTILFVGALLLQSEASAQDTDQLTFRATVAVGHAPIGVAVDPARGLVYVANSADGTVSVLNESPVSVAGTITVGNEPRSVAVDPELGLVFVANWGDHTISAIDESSLGVVGTIFVGPEPGDKLGTGLQVQPNQHKLWVAHEETVNTPGLGPPIEGGYQGANAVSVIDEQSLQVDADVPYGDVFAFALDPDRNLGYAVLHSGYSASASSRLVAFTLDTLSQMNSVNLASATLYSSAAVDVADGRLFLAVPSVARLSVFDAFTALHATYASSATTVPLRWQGVDQAPWEIVQDPLTKVVYVLSHPYVGDQSPTSLLAVSGKTLQVLGGVTLTGVPRGLAVDPQTHLVLITDSSNSTLVVVDGLLA